jgi:hypothetical protein
MVPMGKPEEWVGSARLVQAFDTDELRIIGLLAPAFRVVPFGPHSSTRLPLRRSRDPAKNQ